MRPPQTCRVAGLDAMKRHACVQTVALAWAGFNPTRAVPVQGVVGAAAKLRGLGNKNVLAVDALQVRRA